MIDCISKQVGAKGLSFCDCKVGAMTYCFKVMEVVVLVMLLAFTPMLRVLDVILVLADPSDVDPIISFCED